MEGFMDVILQPKYVFSTQDKGEMQAERRGRNAQVCSYSYPHCTIRTKQMLSQMTELSILEPIELFEEWWRRHRESIKQSGFREAEVLQGFKRFHQRTISISRRNLEMTADFRTRVWCGKWQVPIRYIETGDSVNNSIRNCNSVFVYKDR